MTNISNESVIDSKYNNYESLKIKYPVFIGIHIGAGYHSTKLRNSYKSTINNALEKTLTQLYDKINFEISRQQQDGSELKELDQSSLIDSTWIVESVITQLEDDPLTNAGIGSNLNLDGNVECDASIMSGQFICNCNNNCFSGDGSVNNNGSNNGKINRICGGGIWGGVGAVSGVRNPIKLTTELLRKQQVKGNLKSLGRQRPLMLVGEGAKEWAKEHGIETFDKDNLILGDPLITQQSNVNYLKYKSKLDNHKDNKRYDKNYDKHDYSYVGENDDYEDQDGDNEEQTDLYDTVGAIVVDWNGCISSGVSSGGIILKHSGRVGEAAIFGAGCWAQNELIIPNLNIKLAGVASSATGVGEQLTRSLISKECCLKILKKKFIDTAVQEYFQDSFLSHNDCFSYINELIIQKSTTATVKPTITDKDDSDEEEEEEYYDNSNIISNFNGSSRLGGLITLKKETNENGEMEIEFLWAHTTETMGVGYVTSRMSKPKSFISVNNSKQEPGFAFKISSKSLKIKKE